MSKPFNKNITASFYGKLLLLFLSIPVGLSFIVPLNNLVNSELCEGETTYSRVFQIPLLFVLFVGQTLPRILYLFIFYGKVHLGFGVFPEYKIAWWKELTLFLFHFIIASFAGILATFGRTEFFKRLFHFNIELHLAWVYVIGYFSMVINIYLKCLNNLDVMKLLLASVVSIPHMYIGYFFEVIFYPNIINISSSFEIYLNFVFDANKGTRMLRGALAHAGYDIRSIGEILIAFVFGSIILPLLERLTLQSFVFTHKLLLKSEFLEDLVDIPDPSKRAEVIEQLQRRNQYTFYLSSTALLFEFDRYRSLMVRMVLFNLDSLGLFIFFSLIEILQVLWCLAVKLSDSYISIMMDKLYPEQSSSSSLTIVAVAKVFEKVFKPFLISFCKVINVKEICKSYEYKQWEHWSGSSERHAKNSNEVIVYPISRFPSLDKVLEKNSVDVGLSLKSSSRLSKAYLSRNLALFYGNRYKLSRLKSSTVSRVSQESIGEDYSSQGIVKVDSAQLGTIRGDRDSQDTIREGLVGVDNEALSDNEVSSNESDSSLKTQNLQLSSISITNSTGKVCPDDISRNTSAIISDFIPTETNNIHSTDFSNIQNAHRENIFLYKKPKYPKRIQREDLNYMSKKKRHILVKLRKKVESQLSSPEENEEISSKQVSSSRMRTVELQNQDWSSLDSDLDRAHYNMGFWYRIGEYFAKFKRQYLAIKIALLKQYTTFYIRSVGEAELKNHTRDIRLYSYNHRILIKNLPFLERWPNDKKHRPLKTFQTAHWYDEVISEVQYHHFIRFSVLLISRAIGTIGILIAIIVLEKTNFADIPGFKDDEIVKSDGKLRIAIMASFDIILFIILYVMHMKNRSYKVHINRFRQILHTYIIILNFLSTIMLLFLNTFIRFLISSECCGGYNQIPEWLLNNTSIRC